MNNVPAVQGRDAVTPGLAVHPRGSPKPDRAARGGIRALALAATLGFGGVIAHAMPAAPAGVVETGAPSFDVLGLDALGLSSAPIDLHTLPDGRILVVSRRELAFGDGVRWEVFREEDGLPPIIAQVAVDDDGRIYTGIDSGFARLDLSPGGRWHLTPVAKLPAEAAAQNATLTSVSTVSDQWFWFGGNGAIVSWRPGQTARLAGNAAAIERIFSLGKDGYFSDQSSGTLTRLKPDGTSESVASGLTVVSQTVTCAIPFAPGQLLVGTALEGMKLFDGKTFRPFGASGLLGDGHRITDLCPVGEGFFAASIDTVGIVFFDREGRTLQVLERSLDHRLARVQRVLYSANGVLRALLNDGVARISFPSPVSHFEPLLASGLAYAQPLRHAGKLWILADGRAMRGIYGGGRLDRFEDDTPPGRYLLTLAEVDGQLFGANETGIYVYEEAGWKLILPGIVNARIGVARSAPDGIFYVARGEYGLIQHTGSEFTARRIPKQELGDSYGSVVDSAGIGWLELGSSRVGRLDPHGGQPSCQILGSGDGLPDGWVELYVLDGITRFHVANHLYRFDDTRRKFVEDVELLARIPQLAVAGGRPVTDSFGRLWYTANGGIQVIDHTAAGNNRPVKVPAVGFAPTSYTAEDDGVVWMFEQRHLARLDLRLPETPASPLVAFITSVQFPASGREAFAPGGTLEPLNYADNSLVLHFVAPANPFGVPVTFEFLLNGAGTQWISTGAVGSARFTGLKEGAYTFRVRPVAGSVTRGTEARLAFRVKPPWFRTKLAWTVYIATALALLAFVIWLPSYLQRRKNDNLERLVASRTGELNTTNAQLARQIQETTEKSAALSASEERYRLLNTGLEDRVAERTRELASSVSVLNATFESTTDGIVIVELSGQVKSFNNKFAELWHLPPELRSAGDPEPLIAHVCRQVKEPDRFREWIGRVMVDPQTGSFGLLELVDGRTFEQTAMPCWIDGICVGWVFSVRNITFRKQAEAKLAYERDQFRALLDSIPDTIYFKDTQSRFVLVSRSAVQNAVARLPDLRARRAARGLVVDVPEADLLTGLTDFDTYQDADAQLAFEDEKQIIRSGEALIGKLEQQTFLDHAVRWSLTSKMPWRDPDGKIIGTFGISKDVTDLKETEAKLGQMHEQLIESSRMAGMAEVATGVLHNVGNVLNSVNVSATLVADKVRHSKATNLAKVCSLLAQHQADLANFLTTDPKGRIVPVYLANLSDTLAAEQKSVTAELDNLRKNIEHIKEIVGMQQDYAKTSGVNETVSVPDLVEDALRINTGSLARHEVDVSRDYVARPVVTLDKHKVIQILINLIRNAKYACDESARSDKLITVRTTADLRNFTIAVIDNGIGIPAANLARIFSHGFTTRKAGHGFGLHSGALAARELGGSLSAQSDGPGLGATFTLVLPFKSEATPP